MKIDRYSSTWLNIKDHLDERAAELRSKLEGQGNWEDVVAARAALKEIKLFFTLVRPEEPPLVPTHLDLPV